MEGDDPAGLSEQFRLLAHAYRRHTIEILAEHTTLSLADLAELVAEREADAGLVDIPAERVRDLYLELYHVHVPKLVDAHVLQYDQESDVVSLLDDGRVSLLANGYAPTTGPVGGTDAEGGVTVHLPPETAELVERAVEVDDGLDPSMSYDEVVYRVLAERYG
jgi:hypothetical protein